MNEEDLQLSEKEIKDAKAQQAGKDVADLAGRAASTYFGGAVGNKVYDKVSQTKAGQAILNETGKSLTRNPLAKNALEKSQPAISEAKPALEQATNIAGGSTGSNNEKTKPKSSSKSLKSLFNNSSSKEDTNGVVNTVRKIKKYWPIIVFGLQILMVLFIGILIAAIMMSGILYIQDVFKDSDQKFLNFLSGCGWKDDATCSIEEKNDFYAQVDEIYDDYKGKGVTINRPLIIATLTYDNPFLVDNTDNSFSTDYKKSKKQVKELADSMVTKECYKKNKETGTLTEISCSTIVVESEKYTKVVIYRLDEAKYRRYLEDTFIKKYYLKHITDQSKVNEMTQDIIKEIYARTAFASTLIEGSANNSSINYNVQNITVTVTDCSGTATLEQLSLEEYLQGVVYMYSEGSTSEEYLKYISAAAKNYLYSINGATADYMPTTLRIKNCQLNQLYCNVEEGCHYREGYGTSEDTLDSGPDYNGNYVKEAAEKSYLTVISHIIDTTVTEFMVNNGAVVATKLTLGNLADILLRLETSDYKTVLKENYGGDSDEFSDLSLVATNYPLDIYNNYVTSLYGWRKHPIYGNCSHHNGMDIGAGANSNIYAFASGVVVTNKYHYSYGYYTVLGHGNYNSSTGEYEYYTLYAHQIRLSSFVKVGDEVLTGQKIGSVGSTGDSTGNHLHFEIYSKLNGIKKAEDPAKYFSDIEFRGLDINSPLYTSKQACLAAN